MPINGKYIRIRCPICAAPVLKTRLASHIRKVHGDDDPSKDKRMIKCDICGVSVRRDRLEKHIRQAHIEKPEVKANPATCRFCGATMPQSELAAHRCEESGPLKRSDLPPPIILESKRGTKIESTTRCSECHGLADVVWRYAKSNFGVVHLCRFCKAIVFDRSFGEIDAMDSALTGGFETNPRKH